MLLVSDSDVLDKMAYTLANPTAAGLVKSPYDWPGVISNRFGEEREIQMPDGFFDHDGPLPEALTLRFVRPRIFAGLSDAQLQARLNAEVAKRVKRAREDMTLRGLPFVGRDAVLRQAFSAMPKTPAPRRNPSPRIAAKSTPERVRAIRGMVDFVQEYRAERAIDALRQMARCLRAGSAGVERRRGSTRDCTTNGRASAMVWSASGDAATRTAGVRRRPSLLSFQCHLRCYFSSRFPLALYVITLSRFTFWAYPGSGPLHLVSARAHRHHPRPIHFRGLSWVGSPGSGPQIPSRFSLLARTILRQLPCRPSTASPFSAIQSSCRVSVLTSSDAAPYSIHSFPASAPVS